MTKNVIYENILFLDKMSLDNGEWLYKAVIERAMR